MKKKRLGNDEKQEKWKVGQRRRAIKLKIKRITRVKGGSKKSGHAVFNRGSLKR